MLRIMGTVACAVVVVVLTGGSVMAQAGAGLADDPNGMSAWQGEITVTGPMPGIMEVLAVQIDYSVYAPGQFALSFPGQDPTGGERYIYAYQLFNNLVPHPADQTAYGPDYVSRFSVGLDQDELAGDCSYLLASGIIPDGVDIVGAGSTQAGWDFTLGQMAYSVTPPAISSVLLFSSPYGPELDSATVSGWQTASGQLPSPIPEPATMLVFSAVLAIGTLRNKRRV